MKYRICCLCGILGFYSGLALVPLNGGEPLPVSRKALIIMLDGVRADALDQAQTPNIDRLKAGNWNRYPAAWSDQATPVYDAPPSSGSNHVAIATGVTASKHRVMNNKQLKDGNYRDFPHFFAHLKRVDPTVKTGFFFTWPESGKIGNGGEEIRWKKGETDADTVAAAKDFLSGDMSCAMVFIDFPDAMGHKSGFYPHGAKYLDAITQCDTWIGDLLSTVEKRETFAGEQWLIIITSDHGGYLYSHGMGGGQASTIPLVVASPFVKPGRLAGSPGNVGVARTVFAHFGVDTEGLHLDGRVYGAQTPPPVTGRTLKEDLHYYFTFDEDAPVNRIDAVPLKLQGNAKSGVNEGRFGKSLKFDGAKETFASLPDSEKLAIPNGNFTATMWVKYGSQAGDSLILGNKDWRNGENPGVALISFRKGQMADVPGIMFNIACREGNQRQDLGQYDIMPEWMFLAVTVTNDHSVRFYQGVNGTLYYLSSPCRTPLVTTGMPWMLGQDGTGNYSFGFAGEIDDFALWTRSLNREEIAGIFFAGVPLAHLLNNHK